MLVSFACAFTENGSRRHINLSADKKEPNNRYLIEQACSNAGLFCLFILFLFSSVRFTIPKKLDQFFFATDLTPLVYHNHVHVCLVEQCLPIRRIRSDGNPCGTGSLTSSFRAYTSLCDASQLGITHMVIF